MMVGRQGKIASWTQDDWVIRLHYTFQDDQYLYMVMESGSQENRGVKEFAGSFLDRPAHAVKGSEIRHPPLEIGNFPIIYKVLYVPGGAGFLPSTVYVFGKFRGGKNVGDFEVFGSVWSRYSVDGLRAKVKKRAVG